MMHQPSGGTQGQLSDIEIYTKEVIRSRDALYNIIARHTGKSYDQIKIDADRDRWMTAEEALEYGMADKIMERNEQITSNGASKN